MDKVYVYQAVYGEGKEFSQDVNVELYHDEERALGEMKKDYKNVRKEFIEKGGYDEDDLSVDTTRKNIITLSADEDSDWWEGKVFEKTIKKSY